MALTKEEAERRWLAKRAKGRQPEDLAAKQRQAAEEAARRRRQNEEAAARQRKAKEELVRKQREVLEAHQREAYEQAERQMPQPEEISGTADAPPSAEPPPSHRLPDADVQDVAASSTVMHREEIGEVPAAMARALGGARGALLGAALLGVVAVSASDPCFSAQRFGSGFDVLAGDEGEAPRLEEGELVVQVECVECLQAEFRAQLQGHAAREGLCAIWLELEDPAAGTEEGRKVRREVRAPLPPGAGNCSALLFAFPPGQRFEYYRLTDHAPSELPLAAPWLASREKASALEAGIVREATRKPSQALDACSGFGGRGARE